MIGQLMGTLRDVGGRWVILDGSGVGWSVTPTFAATDGADIDVVVSTTWREGSGPEFWAHLDVDTRDTFEALCAVHGVGPSIAAAVISGLGPTGLFDAVTASDTAAFGPVKGVGPKLAARIVADVVLPEHISGSGNGVAPVSVVVSDELAVALVDLGFDANAVNDAVSAVRSELTDAGDDELLAAALTRLAS